MHSHHANKDYSNCATDLTQTHNAIPAFESSVYKSATTLRHFSRETVKTEHLVLPKAQVLAYTITCCRKRTA